MSRLFCCIQAWKIIIDITYIEKLLDLCEYQNLFMLLEVSSATSSDMICDVPTLHIGYILPCLFFYIHKD